MRFSGMRTFCTWRLISRSNSACSGDTANTTSASSLATSASISSIASWISLASTDPRANDAPFDDRTFVVRTSISYSAKFAAAVEIALSASPTKTACGRMPGCYVLEPQIRPEIPEQTQHGGPDGLHHLECPLSSHVEVGFPGGNRLPQMQQRL